METNNTDIEDVLDDISNIDFGHQDLSEDENAITSSSQSYQDRLNETKISRHKIINVMIKELVKPIEQEQESKNSYRRMVLKIFSIYFVLVTIATFYLIFKFSNCGFTDNEVKISEFLTVGIFANIISLAVIIFKYLFDEKHSLMKDMISLISHVMKSDKKR